jgi:hypothetical protein
MGLMIDNFQALNPLIWSNITPFFRQFYDLIHEPILRTVVDLFWGNYSSFFSGSSQR